MVKVFRAYRGLLSQLNIWFSACVLPSAVKALCLSPAQPILEDVVVVGYGTQKKVNLTGSVSAVTAKE